MKHYISVVLVVLAVLVVQARADNAIQNGQFQTGDFTDWTLGTTSNGTAGQGFPIVGTWPGGGGINAWEGEVGENTEQFQAAGATLTQSFNVDGAGLARLHFLIAAVGGPNNGDSDGGEFALKLDGTTLISYDMGAIGPNQLIWRGEDVYQNLTVGQHTLEIDVTRQGISVPGQTPYQFVTDVFVEPEPSSLILMGSGVLAVLGTLRRRLG